MTNSEAIKILRGAIKKPNTEDGYIGQAISMAIKALEDKGYYQGYSDGFSDAVRVKKVLRPKGEWIKIGDIGLAYKCSNCNEIDCKASSYCPNCGANMRESEGCD